MRKLAGLMFMVAMVSGCGAPGQPFSLEESAATAPSFTIKGRLLIPDAYDCTGGTTSVAMRWSDCHAFKHHLNPTTGAAITSNRFVAGAVRPLAARVDVVYQPTPGSTICFGDAQTDENGFFSAPIANCAQGQQSFVSLTVQLSYAIQNPISPGTGLGTVRAVWAKENIPQTYLNDPVYSTTDVNGTVSNFIIPAFAPTRTFRSAPAANGVVDLGNQTIDGQDFGPQFSAFTRGALAAWQNVIALHLRLRGLLRQSGADPFGNYARILPTVPAYACTNCYSLLFDLPGQFGGGSGGGGAMVTAAPKSDTTEGEVMALSSAGVLAHELGHSINDSLAPSSMYFDDYFHAGATNPDGSSYGVSHSPFLAVAGNVPQLQESGQAMVEGFGDAMARFLLLDGCNGNNPQFNDLGSPDPLTNMWRPAQYLWCDPNRDSGCPTHNLRRQLTARGISEGSAEWTRRTSALNTLAAAAAAGGMRWVLSNNELRAEQFYCRLLAQSPDYASMAGQVRGLNYIDDYSFLVSEILDGRNPTPLWRRYASDVTSARPRVTLLQLLQAMSAVCSDCNQIPSPLPEPLWRLPALTDGANGQYNALRISTHGRLSAQNLAGIVIANGLATRSQMNNLLRATFMEELD
ncbi:MAG TPA: hypothetical protein VFH68_26995 [Polyangia bacterium]|jgi:hypothetical protein|nr:hypothetical protein [Polyangia bacterium]